MGNQRGGNNLIHPTDGGDMKVYAPAAVTVTGLNATGWDANLLPAGAFTYDITTTANLSNTFRGAIMVLGGTLK
jgi:hypothetical protein